MNNIIISLLGLLLTITSFAQKKLEFEGGKDPLAVTTRMDRNIPGSRVIFESEFKLKFTSNMGDISNENIGSGVINGLNADTLYFFLPSNNNKRRISISADGYPDLVIPFTLGAKETYKYLIFDPKKMNSYDDNYRKGVDYLSKGLYNDAIFRFEQAADCSDIPTNNDVNEKINISKQCKQYSEQLNYFISRKDWDNAYNACTYLLVNSPDNEIYKSQLNIINENRGVKKEPNRKKIAYISKLTSSSNVNNELLAKIGNDITKGFFEAKRLEIKDATLDSDLMKHLDQNQGGMDKSLIDKLQNSEADYFIYTNLNFLGIKKSEVRSRNNTNTNTSSESVVVNYTLRIFDINKGVLEESKTIEKSRLGNDITKGVNDLSYSISHSISSFINEHFKVEGIILQIASEKKNKATEVFINKGTGDGVVQGQRFDVFIVNNLGNKIFGEKIADLKLIKEDYDISKCKVTKGGDKIVEYINKGQILKIESRPAGLLEF